LLPDPKDKIEEQNLLHAAMMASENEEPAKARASLEKLLQSDSRSVIALSLLGRIEIDSGNHKKALEYLRRAHALRPDDAALTVDYARAQEAAGDLTGASATLQASLKKDANQFPARLLLGKIYFHSGNAEAALDQLEEAALLQPENVEAKTALARVLLDEKKFGDVVELLQPVATTSSNDADVFVWLGEAYRALGQIKEAQGAEARAKALQTKQK
jgi:predicted Zn-dependent protease